ncbi:MAG: hypothetical protein ACI8UO_002524 [Verrucomicrobiales bacterium]
MEEIESQLDENLPPESLMASQQLLTGLKEALDQAEHELVEA